MSELIGKVKVQQWEYTAEFNYSQYPTKPALNSYGSEGWELVSIVQPTDSNAPWILYFKRPLP